MASNLTVVPGYFASNFFLYSWKIVFTMSVRWVSTVISPETVVPPPGLSSPQADSAA